MRHSAPREAMALSAAQRACKDRILTQPHPARIGNTVDAVVLKHGRLFMLADDTGDVPWRGPTATAPSPAAPLCPPASVPAPTPRPPPRPPCPPTPAAHHHPPS